MRRTLIILSAVAAFGALAPIAQAQTTRSTELPGNRPLAAYSMQQRDYVRGYVRQRPMSEFQTTAPGVAGGAQSSSQTSATNPAGANVGGNIALGANVPSSVQLRAIENPEYSGFRYGRVGSQYVIVDQNGSILDTFE
jgi:hypothetical protein